MSRTHGESTRKERIHLIPSHQPAGSRTESVQGSQRVPRFMAPPFRRYSQVVAVYDGDTWRMWMVRRDVPILQLFAARFLHRSVFGIFPGLSCLLFVQRFLGCARVFSGFSAFPQIPGFVRGSPPAPSWHSLGGNLAIWVVRGSPLVVRWHTLDGNPASSRRGPALQALARQEHLGSAVPLGHPFVLKYEVYASYTSSSSGVLRWIPRGTQGLFQDAWNKAFSVREEIRSATR